MAQPEPNAAREPETLEKEATHALEEARMVIPGVQALFGFQLMAVFSQPFFALLSSGAQRLHLGCLMLTAVTIALLMAPAAYHRQAEPHHISRSFLRLSSVLLTLGMTTLMLSIAGDCYLIAQMILQQWRLSGLLVAALGVLYLGLWFVLPRLARSRLKRS